MGDELAIYIAFSKWVIVELDLYDEVQEYEGGEKKVFLRVSNGRNVLKESGRRSRK